MRLSRKTLYMAAAPLTLAGLLASSAATQASAAVHPPQRHVAAGSMALGGPLQYERFNAYQGFGRYLGGVEYTNWAYAEPGSGVFAPLAGPHALNILFGGTYAHVLDGGLKLTALSPDRLAFRGTGSYTGQAGATWKIAGVVDRGKVRAVIEYTGTLNPGYKVVLTGQVNPADGSAAGAANSSAGQAMQFTLAPGTFGAVLHYHAGIQSDRIAGRDATFQFTIPRGEPAGLAGVKVTVKVHDGGWGARHDTYRHGVAPAPLTQYPIIGGPGVTVR
jgi:hypothetical protein